MIKVGIIVGSTRPEATTNKEKEEDQEVAGGAEGARKASFLHSRKFVLPRAVCVLLARFRVFFRDLRVICRSVGSATAVRNPRHPSGRKHPLRDSPFCGPGYRTQLSDELPTAAA